MRFRQGCILLSALLCAGQWAAAQNIQSSAATNRPGTFAPEDRVIARMFLVGDGGEFNNGHHPVADWLKKYVDWKDTTNSLVLLGDNIYPKGMPAPGSKTRAEAVSILDSQISVVRGFPAKAWVIPGNHDWKQGRPGGWEQIKNQGAYIDSLDLPNVKMLPEFGCPGPVVVPVNDRMILVCMDSQWWLHREARPGSESTCDCKTEDEIITALKDIVSSYPDKLIVLAMHHAFHTHGEHGGYYTLKQHIFPLTDMKENLYIPLPVIGSAYPIARGVFGNIQDTRNPRYKDLIQRVESVIQGHKNVIHVAGHEHTLQLLEKDSIYYVVSGAGSKHTRVKMGQYSLFARSEVGFAVLELTAGGKTTIKFYTPASGGLDSAIYTASMPDLPAPLKESEIQAQQQFPDSVTVAASTEFHAGPFKRFWLGKNYRTEWTTPVRVKVFDMTGWTPLRRGGGMQTRSLRVANADGRQYVLRSVAKYVTDAALPEEFQGTFVKDLVSDGVSASYPYAALSIPPFARAMQVPHANPQLFYIPDDPRLGRFRGDYGNMFALFEEREPGADKTYNNDDLVRKLVKDNDNRIDAQKVLQARLLDMFFMDFDRHEDQWRWGAADNGKGKTYFPVPRDRDQPFFINSGIIPRIAGSSWLTPQLQGFRAKARNINTYNHNARNFDRSYLNEPDEAMWRSEAKQLLDKMTDSLIEYALHCQPKEVQPYAMNTIIATLKERRKYYEEEMITYYKFLSKIVTVYGSDKRELFDVLRQEDGSVTVTVFKINKNGEAKQKMYERRFVAGVTKEIRLYGLGGEDRFYEHGSGARSITVRMIGGPGSDVFDNESDAPAGKTRIYDLRADKNQITGKGAVRNFQSDDPAVNAVNRLGFKYNVLMPLISASYNPDDGLFLGLGFRYTTQGFHKEPYKQLHELAATHALATRAYDFKYHFEAIGAVGKMDLLFDASVKAPNNTINFFRLGNETIFDKSGGKEISYYRTRFTLVDADLLLRKKLTSQVTIAAGPAFQYFSIDSTDNRGRLIDYPSLNGLDSLTLYKRKTYAGGKASLIIDDRNDKIMPTLGVHWQTDLLAFGGLNNNSKQYTQLNSNLSLFTSFSTHANLVIATRLGWGKTFGNYEFYQAQFLGGTENLRGYRKFRFAGDEMVYHNLDLRIRVADFATYLFPGSFGLQFFNDVGRVWVKGESSEQWHDGYGGGVWLSILKKMVVTASYTRGTDGGLALITWGFQY